MTGRGRGRLNWMASLVRNLRRGAQADAELDEHARSYVELLVDENLARGMSPDEARRAALVAFGGLESAKEQTRTVRAGAGLAEIWRDVRYALRLARRAPAFSATAVLTLALGIGANTAVFSVVGGVLLHDLPYGDPERVVTFQNRDAQGTFGVSERERLIYGGESSIFESFATYYFSAVNMTGAGDAERLNGAVVDANIFDTLGVKPLRGRLLRPDDAAGGPGTVAILTESFWTRRFGRDESLVGRRVTLDGQPRTVVGILAADVRLPGNFTGSPVEAYLPLVWAGPPDPENIHYLEAVARLDEGVSLAQAGERLRTLAADVRQQIATLPDTYSAHLIPAGDAVLGEVRPGLIAVWGAVGLLLLIACGNLAGLLLARSEQRGVELALRSALGASRRRLIRQMLTESVLFAVVGGAAGTGLAVIAVRLLVALGPDLPRIDRIGVDGEALAYTAGLAIVTGVIFGVLPALSLSRRGSLRQVSSGSARGAGAALSPRVRRPLIAVQVALSVTLAIGAGLLARSATALAAVPTGFDSAGVLTMRLSVPPAAYPTRTATRRFLGEVLTEVRRLPGVIEAGATTHLPLADGLGDWGLIVEGLPERDENGRRPNADWSAVTDGYFDAMGIRVVEGRTYGTGDVDGAPLVTVINERLAREYFPGQSPIGRRMRMSSTLDPVDRQIIGVVADVRHDGLDQPPPRQMFLPLAQFPAGREDGGGSRTMVVRSASDPLLLVNVIRDIVRRHDPNVPIAQVQAMDDIVAASTSASRLFLVLFGVFSGLAMAIVAVGVYGVTSYTVAARGRELAVRRALGASPAAVVGLVLREGAMLAGVGVATGTLAAAGLSSLIDSLLFGVTNRDPLTFVLVPAVVIAVTVVASLGPAGRAVRESPTVALRS